MVLGGVAVISLTQDIQQLELNGEIYAIFHTDVLLGLVPSSREVWQREPYFVFQCPHRHSSTSGI